MSFLSENSEKSGLLLVYFSINNIVYKQSEPAGIPAGSDYYDASSL